VTRLRQLMLEELQRRNYAATTREYYLRTLTRFARYFRRPPDRLTQHHIRSYQTYLLRERRLHPHSVRREVAALRFFYVKTLRRRYLVDDTPYPKVPRRLPTVLTPEEVQRLIAAARTLSERAMLMALYSTGMRNAELRHLQVRDIDSRAMLIHVSHGKGGRDRYVPLSATLLATLREHWRWMKPKTWLFPGTLHNWRADRPVTPKVVWDACRAAAAGRGSPSASRPTRFATRLRRTSWKRGPTFERSSSSSAMHRSDTPSSICIYHRVTCRRSSIRSMR
jgi:integrase/recombinase XerD